jgi:hypothetical protein
MDTQGGLFTGPQFVAILVSGLKIERVPCVQNAFRSLWKHVGLFAVKYYSITVTFRLTACVPDRRAFNFISTKCKYSLIQWRPINRIEKCR